MLSHALIAAVAILASAIAAVTGFGVGSLLTPTLAIETGVKLAVAAISIPHLIATAQRFWMLRAHVDRQVLVSFGITSAIGGLAGALIHTRVSSRALTVAFGVVVVLAGISELTGWMRRVRWGRRSAWVAGVLSGALGGMVGNQGGIRSAALLAFRVPKESFVATATAIGLFVDGARMPVYLATQYRDILRIWPIVLTASIAVVIGTMFGTRALGRIPERTFRRMVAVLLIVLGLYMTGVGVRGLTRDSRSESRVESRGTRSRIPSTPDSRLTPRISSQPPYPASPSTADKPPHSPARHPSRSAPR